jgi:phosphate starvation-inducible membrane PsiE
LKVGIIVGLTVIVKLVVVAHCPEVGVKVYVVVAWLFNAGFHVPVIPFKDEMGKTANTSP